MHRKGVSVALVMLFLLTPLSGFADESSANVENPTPTLLNERFQGFFIGEGTDVWNETPWPDVAMPGGFSFDNVIDYSDVGVLINNLSEESRTIGWAFVAARNISLDRVFIFNETGTPTGETINREKFNTYFAWPLLEMLQNRSSSDEINYLVTTKGIPLRVSGGNDRASFDQEISLLGGTYNNSIGGNYWVTHNYGPLAGKDMETFTRDEYGFFLVTRLTGYTVETALGLIERANQSLGERGLTVLDLATNRNGSGYKYWNDDLYAANATLNGSMGLPVHFDEETGFVTNISNVMMYASWGSNDGNWNTNRLPNSGFDTGDATSSMNSKHWDRELPAVNAEEGFNWTYQTSTKQGGNGALEGIFSPNCTGGDGPSTSGLLAEYYDNTGVTLASPMPYLSDRSPGAIRIETHLDWTSRNSAYPGLDTRFNTDWSGRFTGSVNVPETGNWTLYLESDDGSELWLDHQSLIQNHGSHGMRTVSNYINLTEGEHEIRVEVFQGGGPHGLRLFWSGPNQSKVIIPPSAFTVSSSELPMQSDVIHRWEFEEGSGSITNDSVGTAHMSLNNMNASSWVNCPGGTCLYFDGINDFIDVNVDDWAGNFTVSQFVLTNTTNQSAYASTFAVGDVAGSSISFQHMMQSSGWYLHNNQTSRFGDVVEKKWAHLATVFDNGSVVQYMNGQLVNSVSTSNGTYNSIDLYKMGVNRAGSAYFEGLIDQVTVYDVALDSSRVHRLSREMLVNCQSYSGANQETTAIWQTMTMPENQTDHAWIVYAYGLAEGAIGGTYTIVVEGMDSQGNVLSTNRSGDKNYATTWNSQTMRFRPHAQATHFNISVEIMLSGATQGGSIYLDTMNLRSIRPHMGWINGSIAETAVSTGGRSFNWNTGYGQSLVADLLEDGVSGVKGYVYEPYLTAVGYPSVLLPAYASGYNFAESHAAANLQTGWMGVVVGDPKMAAYADQFHDINIVDVRILGDVNLNENTTLQVLLENIGMAAANGSLQIQTVQGNSIISEMNISLPEGDLPGSRAIMNMTFNPQQTGYLDLRIRYINDTAERYYANNVHPITALVNAPPVILDAYCSASSLARGGYTICTVEANDDLNTTGAVLEWQIQVPGTSLNHSLWQSQSMGRLDALRWETTLVVPVNASLGHIALRVHVQDINGMTDTAIFENVTHIVDAPQTWFGPHLTGVDPVDWNQASILPNRPTTGLYRGEEIALKACVMDADFDPNGISLTLSANRGDLTNLSYSPEQAANLHCYSSTFELEVGMALDDVTFELRTEAGGLLLQRTIRVADQAPIIQLQIEDEDGTKLDRVVGNGAEYAVVEVIDIDDPGTSFLGDIMIQWPGGDLIQLPLDIGVNNSQTRFHLEQVLAPLEGGQLHLEATGIGKHGSSASGSLSIQFILTSPEIVFMDVCDALGPQRTMTFGQIATLRVAVTSDRPLQSTSSQLTQSGWAINAPLTETPVWGEEAAPMTCDKEFNDSEVEWFNFRVKLDNSLTDGEGKVLFSVTNLEGLVKSQSIEMMFQHAPTEMGVLESSDAEPQTDLNFSLVIADLDGLQSVICSFQLYDASQNLLTQSVQGAGAETEFQNTLFWMYPIPLSLANQTLSATVRCIDERGITVTSDLNLTVGQAPECDDCEPIINDDVSDTSNQRSLQAALPLLAGGLIFILMMTVTILRITRKRLDESDDWKGDLVGESSLDSMESLFESPSDTSLLGELETGLVDISLPEGWTAEQYLAWLTGPCPDGWTEVQWNERVQGEKFTVEQMIESSEG